MVLGKSQNRICLPLSLGDPDTHVEDLYSMQHSKIPTYEIS